MSGYSDIPNGSLCAQQMAGFFSRSKSATLDNAARRELVSRSRILYLESPIARACIDILLRECIGSGLRYAPAETSPYFDNYTAITNALSSDLSKASALHMIENTRRLTFVQVQALVFRTILLSGDCFVVTLDDGSICIKESDYVFTPGFLNPVAETGVAYFEGRVVIDGVELSETGNPVAYWMCNNLYGQRELRENWTRVPVYDENGVKQVLHCAYFERPGQVRGLPLLSPVIEDLWSLRAYLTSETQMAILQANMSLVVTTNTNPTTNPFAALSQADLDAPLVTEPPKEREKSSDFSIAPPPMSEALYNGLLRKTNFVSAGQSIHLAEGEDVKMITPTAPHSGLETFIRCVCEQIGAAVGIPSQILLARIDSNYASVKAAFAELQHTVRLYRGMFTETFLKPFFEGFVYRDILDHGWSSDKYDEQSAALLLATESIWLPSVPPTVLEPNREIEFYAKALELGLVSRDEVAVMLFGHEANGENTSNSIIE